MPPEFPEKLPARRVSPEVEAALRRFDKENSGDPKTIAYAGETLPYEVFYSRCVTDWVRRLWPAASDALLLASRCQHLRRWEIPRASYEMTRAGYLRWRADLKVFHARKSAEILQELGFRAATIERVEALNLKRHLGRDEEMQVLEDALCLVTLQHQLGDLMEKTDAEKLVGILQKTWKKMSTAAREEALRLSYTADARALLERALADAAGGLPHGSAGPAHP